ncbi:putative oxidoreductase [Limimaricola soesokkakensis]|uniref:Oxidoreductase YdhF n=1 Tax=Limimaricola soesokkakensis TaxID=1343159 RepID=A0A1X6Z5S3_9RHOB|nr:aldo/keto reductase [Limimaricola soesokkakensis]PSK86773.1 putative oxidoreductase [Limimaricola soesokkakensis]SLN41612.1 Oxidoreductase YdhF [Limimaricola soesokkakensis]
MDRIEISRDVALSRLVYGMWRIADDSDTSPAHVRAKIDACLEQGITTMDQADIYGGYGAEAVLGAALKEDPSLRDRIEIVSKCGIVAPMGRHADKTVKHYDTSRAYIEQAVETSLRDMGIEYLDLLLIHRPDPMMDPRETGAALDALVASGKVRAVGVSNFRPWDVELLESAMDTPLATNQIEISLKELAPFTNGDLAYHQRRNIPLMAWSPLGGGDLMRGQGPVAERLDRIARAQGVDRAAVAVAFLLAHPAGILPVLGTNNVERIAKISDALKVEIDRETWFLLYEAGLGTEVP